MPANDVGPLRLLDRNDEHLGFILLPGDGCPLDVETFEGDCIFMPLPQNPAILHGPEYSLLAEHKEAGEHRYRLTKQGAQLRFDFAGPLARKLWLTVDPTGRGEWGVSSKQGDEQVGYSHRVKAESEGDE